MIFFVFNYISFKNFNLIDSLRNDFTYFYNLLTILSVAVSVKLLLNTEERKEEKQVDVQMLIRVLCDFSVRLHLNRLSSERIMIN